MSFNEEDEELNIEELEAELLRLKLSESDKLPLRAEDFYQLSDEVKQVFLDYAYFIIITLGLEEKNRKNMIEKLELELFRLNLLENGGFPSRLEKIPRLFRDDKDLLLEFAYYYAKKNIVLDALNSNQLGNLFKYFMLEKIGIRLKPKMRDNLKEMTFKSMKWKETKGF